MRFTWTTERNGRVGISATASGYDASPWLDTLWMDRAPQNRSADRVAVAAALTFGHLCGGHMEFDSPVAAGVASAIRNLLPDVTSVTPMDFDQHPFPFGAGPVLLSTSLDLGDDGPTEPGTVPGSICVLDAGRYSGAMMTHRSLAVASNAAVLDARATQQGRPRYAALAVAALFAGDVGADCIQTEPELVTPEVRRLLVACGLRLTSRYEGARVSAV